nr:DMT family transporter [Nakamurella flavida]
MALLALNGFSVGTGEALTLVSAALYALHIVGLGVWATARNALGLAVVQAVVTAVICAAGAVVHDPGANFLPSGAVDWTVLVYLAVIPGAVALVAQSWAQAHLDPSRAAIIMSTEPVWAAVLAITFLDEELTWRITLGGLLMLTAMAIVESGALRLGRRRHGRAGRGTPSGAPPDR